MNGMTINYKRIYIFLFVSSAILGYCLGYGKLYAFHIFSLGYIASLALGFLTIKKSALKILAPVIFIYICILISSIFKNSLLSYTYLFYYTCAFLCLLFLANVTKKENIFFAYKIIFLFLFINLLIGLGEGLGVFRLPMSPYSSYFDLFGRNLSEVNPKLIALQGANYPTGFNFNQNNYGFVVLIFFPYLYLHPNKVVRFISMPAIVFIAYSIGSKGFLLGILSFFMFYILFFLNLTRKIIIIPFLFLLFIVVFLWGVDFDNRMWAAFSQIERGFSLMLEGRISPLDSTSERAYIYLLGVKELLSTYGFGVGVGGISEILLFRGDTVASFHFFFLEFIVDMGIFLGLFFFIFYYINIRRLIYRSKIEEGFVAYLNKATALSLLVAVPASISPSSIIYILTFWIVLGFSLSLYYLSDNKTEAT